MPKLMQYVAIALLSLVALLAVAAVIIAATFDPNDHKPTIIKLVEEKKQRTLSIPSEIKLTFFPSLGADLGKISIFEHKGKAEFASIQSARFSLQLLALLSRQLVVEQIRIDGLNAYIKRFNDGRTNFDDLLSQEESQQQIQFDISGISIANTTIRYDDQLQRQKLELSELDLHTGKIANKVHSKFSLKTRINSNNPATDARLALTSGFMADLDNKHYALKNTDAELTGKRAGAALEGAMTSALSANLKTQAVDLSGIVATFSLPNPASGVLKLDGNGRAHADLNKKTLSAILKGRFDESAFDAKLGMPGFSPAAYTFDVAVDRFDLDRYR